MYEWGDLLGRWWVMSFVRILHCLRFVGNHVVLYLVLDMWDFERRG